MQGYLMTKGLQPGKATARHRPAGTPKRSGRQERAVALDEKYHKPSPGARRTSRGRVPPPGTRDVTRAGRKLARSSSPRKRKLAEQVRKSHRRPRR